MITTAAWRKLVSLPALLAALVLLAVPAAADAASVRITSFSSDRTLRNMGPTDVSAFCRRGFELLSVRLNVIGVNPTPTENPATHPRIAIVGMVPARKGVTVSLLNLRAPGVAATVRATADCAKAGGRARSSAARAVAAGAGGKRIDLDTYLVKEKKRVGASSDAVKRVKALCHKRNSLPSDLGFEARRASFAGAVPFEKGKQVGFKAKFRTDGADKLKLHLVCKKGERLKLMGNVAGAGAASLDRGRPRPSGGAGPRAKGAGGKPKLKVKYVRTGGAFRADFPFPGLDSLIDRLSRNYWTPPVPVGIPAEVVWSGRLLLDSAFVSRAASATASGGPGDPLGVFGAAVGGDEGRIFDGLSTAFIKGTSRIRFKDRRTGDGIGGGGDGDSEPECSDGVDNGDLEDAVADRDDPGCLTGPAGGYDPADASEKDSSEDPCPEAPNTVSQGFLQVNHTDKTLNGYTLSYDGLVEHQGPGASEGPINLGPLCGSGTEVEATFTALAGGGGRIDFTTTTAGDGAGHGASVLNLALNER